MNIDKMLNNIIGKNSIGRGIVGDRFSFNVFDSKEYMRKYQQKPEVKERRRLQMQEYLQNPETKEKYRQYQQEYSQRPGVKEKIRLYQQRPEVKEKMRLYWQEYYQRPEVKEKKRVQQQEYLQRPEVKERRKEHYQRPGVKEKIIQYQQKRYQLPEIKEQRLHNLRKQRIIESKERQKQAKAIGISPLMEKEVEPLFQESMKVWQQEPKEKENPDIDKEGKDMVWAKEKTNEEDIDIEPMQKERYSFLGKRKVYMTPQQFLDNARLAQIGFELNRPGIDMDKDRETRFFEKPEKFEQLYTTNPEHIDYLKRKIASKSTKVHLPYMTFEGHLPMEVEGRHRAIAAKRLGIEKIPVIILTEGNMPEKSTEEIKQRQLNPKRTLEQIRGKYYASKDVEKEKEEGMTTLFGEQKPVSDETTKQYKILPIIDLRCYK